MRCYTFSNRAWVCPIDVYTHKWEHAYTRLIAHVDINQSGMPINLVFLVTEKFSLLWCVWRMHLIVCCRTVWASGRTSVSLARRTDRTAVVDRHSHPLAFKRGAQSWKSSFRCSAYSLSYPGSNTKHPHHHQPHALIPIHHRIILPSMLLLVFGCVFNSIALWVSVLLQNVTI